MLAVAARTAVASNMTWSYTLERLSDLLEQSRELTHKPLTKDMTPGTMVD
jgi:hypothetical protein